VKSKLRVNGRAPKLVPCFFIEVLLLISAGWFFFYTFIFEAFWWHKDFWAILTYGVRTGNLIFFLISISSIFIFEYKKRRTEYRSVLGAFKQISFRGMRKNKKTNQPQNNAVISEKLGKTLQDPPLDKDLVVIQKYPLNEPFAYAAIVRDKVRGNLTYLVKEPSLSEDEGFLLKRLKDLLLEVLDVGIQELDSKEEAKKYLEKKCRGLLEQHFKVSDLTKEKLLYYVIRDNYGFGNIDPLMHDPLLEDISCDGVKTNLYVWHRDYESIPTNLRFESTNELDSFALRLAYLCGRHISIAQPMLDSSLPDGSRLHLTYGKEITRKGSTFTIRKFRADPLTIVDLMNFKTLSPEMAAYLWYAVENRISTLVCGGIASGKTTMLNCLSMFIKPDLKIVSIEDTPELNLPHENWVPTNTRTHFGLGTEKVDITLFDLLKSCLRQRPDYIIVGEVRGQEAYTLFQAVSTGHLGMSTLHAESVKAAVYRLESEPMNIPRTLISGIDIMLVQRRTKAGDGTSRKTVQVSEIVGLDPRSREILTNDVFKWNASNDAFEYTGRSYLVERIAARDGISLEEANREIVKRAKIIEWMARRNIRNFKEVSDLTRRYYEQPEKVFLEASEGES
jgi:flagellar protein FlaI